MEGIGLTVIAGLIALPFLIWSWMHDHNEEDADLAAGLVGWMVVAAAGAGIAWYVFW